MNYNKQRKTLFWNFVQFCLLVCSILSVTADDSNPGDASNGVGVGWGRYVIGAIFLVVGLVFLFAGKKLIKVLVFVGGFLGLAMLVVTIAGLVVDLNTLTSQQNMILWICIAIFGIIGGLMAWCVWQFGLAIIGFLFGLQLGRFILRINFIPNSNTQMWIILGCALGGAILMFFFSNVIIIVVTAFMGSDLFMCGIDFLANIGYVQFRNASYENGHIVSPSGSVWAMMGSVIVLTLIGCLIQFKS